MEHVVRDGHDARTMACGRLPVAAVDGVVEPLAGTPVVRTMVIADTNGVHELPVVFCSCKGAPDEHMQLFDMGLYPATSKRPQTAFTFRLLDDVLLTAKACKTSIQNYYNKLRRLTNDLFPHTVPVSDCHRLYPVRAAVSDDNPRTGIGISSGYRDNGAT